MSPVHLSFHQVHHYSLHNPNKMVIWKKEQPGKTLKEYLKLIAPSAWVILFSI
jgi:hypothetical protein